MKPIGEKIRELREARDFSLRELAKAIKVSPAFLSDVELGQRHPSDDHLVAIAKKLKIPLDELKKSDTRPPLREIRKVSTSNPEYGYAFRKIVDRIADRSIGPEDLVNFANRKGRGKDGGGNR